VLVSGISLVVYIVGALLLYRRLETFGLALAVAIASSANFLLLVVFLRRRVGSLGLSELVLPSLRNALAAGLCGGAAWGTAKLGVWHLGGAAARNYGVLALAVAAGGATYVVVSYLLGSAELRQLAAALARRRRPASKPQDEPPGADDAQ
jgi:putative peptidoglycan lipid II flippase